MGSVVDPVWLELLYRDGRLDLPESHSGRWAARTAAIRLSGSHREQVTAWLKAVAEEHRREPAGCAAIVDVLLSMDDPEFETALAVAARHPRDRIILSHFGYAPRRRKTPSDTIVFRCADIFLNALTPEDRQSGQNANSGWKPHPGGADGHLADALRRGWRIQRDEAASVLLSRKMARMPLQYGAYSLFPMGRNWQLPITVLCENDFDEYHGEPRHAIGGCLLSILTKAMGWLPAAELLELTEQAPDGLAGRLRTWILSAAPDAAPDAMVAEIEQAISSRFPNSDDIALLDRIALEFGPDCLTDRCRAALGDPPSVAEASRAWPLANCCPAGDSRTCGPACFPKRPPQRGPKRRLPHILAAQIGPPENRAYYLGLQDDPDSDISAEWVQSPLSAEHLRGLGPERAADEIAAWRPQQHDSPSAIILIADVLEQLVRDDPDGWLCDPLPVAVRLRHPTYIARYLRAANRATKEVPAAFGTATVGGLIDVFVHGPGGAVASRDARRKRPVGWPLRLRLEPDPPRRGQTWRKRCWTPA